MVFSTDAACLRAASLAIGVLSASSAWASPRVVVSIPPIASLVDNVMKGVGTATTLVPSGASLHSYALKPTDAAALQSANAIFWVGPALETFLDRPIQNLGGNSTIVALMSAPGVKLLKGREGGVWEEHEEHEEHTDEGHDQKASEHGDHEDHDHESDGHIFLDPMNAKAIVITVLDTLRKIDPANAPTYARNAAALAARIDALDAELVTTLAPVKTKPFIVFHDGYQYFERRYGLMAAGSITVSPERPPGAGRVAEIRKKIANLGAVCVFAEPQFEPKLITTLIDGTKAGTGTLDPEGASLPEGPDLYFALMRALGRNLSACLSAH